MSNSAYEILGLMSGTSLDGLDMAYCRFDLQDNGQWDFELLAGKTLSYSEEWKERLANAIELDEDAHQNLHLEYAGLLAEHSRAFLKEINKTPDLVGSHGHTSHHRPQDGISFQLGDGQTLATLLNIPVVANFRQGDVELGGQGAPLVPIGDQLLFSDFSACLNLGGIANISFQNEQKERIAFDIGLANMGLNYLMRDQHPPYDKDGREARSGKINRALLEQLNSLPYFSLSPPKSTGLEWFKKDIQPLLDQSDLPRADLLCTLIQHMSEQIARVLPKADQKGEPSVLITGGGAYNSYWMQELKKVLPAPYELVIPQDDWIEFKEALVFAFMALLRQREEINIYASVTGAKRNSSGGDLFHPHSSKGR